MAGSSGAIRAGRAFVELFTKNEGLKRGLDQAQAMLNNFGQSVQRLGLRIASLGAGLLSALLAPALALRSLRDRAADLGFGLNAKDAAIADALALAMKRLQIAITGGLLKVGVALAPVLTRIVNALASLVEWGVKFIDKNRGMVVGLAALAVGAIAVGAAIYAVGVAISAVGAIIGTVTTIVSAMGFAWGAFTAILSEPWLLAIAAAFVVVAGAVYAFFRYTSLGQAMLTNFIGYLRQLATTFKNVIVGMADAMAAGDLELASKIMWKGVEVEWRRGIIGLQKAILDFNAWMESIGKDALTVKGIEFGVGIAKSLLDVQLRDAQDELAKLNAEAKAKAAKASDPGFVAAVKNNSTAGTFNAAQGISRLGNNDFPKRIAVATETMVKLMQNAARGGGPVMPAVVK